MVFFEDKDEDGLLVTELAIDSVGLEAKQRLWYYPFGMHMEGIGQTITKPNSDYRYNGKEYDQSTGLYDYGARYYDPAIAKWGQVDPLAEEYAPYSPYKYVLGNPIRLTDPDGMAPSDIIVTIRDPQGNAYLRLDYKMMVNCTILLQALYMKVITQKLLIFEMQ